MNTKPPSNHGVVSGHHYGLCIGVMTVLVGRVTGARVLGRDVPDGQRRAWELH